jgi:hypothetical protein
MELSEVRELNLVEKILMEFLTFFIIAIGE